MTEFKRQKKKKKKTLIQNLTKYFQGIKCLFGIDLTFLCIKKKKKAAFKIKQKNFILINREHWSPFGYIYKIALKMILWEVAHWISPQRNKCRKVSMGHCWISTDELNNNCEEFIISVIAHVENADDKPCVQFKQNSSVLPFC